MFLYTFLVRCYGVILRLAALRSAKARQWVEGRKEWRTHLRDQVSTLGPGTRVWVHCASYGEFEQGRPLIEALKNKVPGQKIILSFFSPSGYEAFKRWPGADIICYLPLDTRRNAADFIEILKPDTILFIKYEFWVNFLFRIRELKIPAFLVSAVFKPHHPFFKWYGKIFRNSLLAFNRLFIQDENSGDLLRSIHITNFEVCGDTRFDRVVEIRDHFKPLSFFDEFCKNSTVIIAGSTWPQDEELLVGVFQKFEHQNLKLIIAPHNIDEKHIVRLTQSLRGNNMTYTSYSDKQHNMAANVLIIDTIGLLSKIYYYANVTYIGGGFNSGIHNCLEPSVFLKPVLFYGNGYEKYNEAVDLIRLGAARNVLNSTDLEAGILYFIGDTQNLKKIESRLSHYFEKNSGVTKKILDSVIGH